MSDRRALYELVVGTALLMPSPQAIGHAALEWKAARFAWNAALEELGLSEGEARELGAQRIRERMRDL